MSKQRDREFICGRIEAAGGFDEVNRLVLGALREWLTGAACEALEAADASGTVPWDELSGLLNGIAILYNDQGKYEQAEPLCVRDLEGSEAALGPSHPETLLSVTNLGVLRRKQGRPQEAEPLLRRAVQGQQAALGATHQLSVYAAMALALLLVQERRGDDEAAALWHFDCALGPQIPETLRDVRELVALLRERGASARTDELEGCFELV